MDFKWKPMHQKEMKNRMMMEEGSNWIKMKLKNKLRLKKKHKKKKKLNRKKLLKSKKKLNS